MSKNIVLACLAIAALAAGCTGNLNASVTPGTPGASTAPNVSASAGVSVGASTAPVAGNADATMAAIYKLGRKWSYLTTTDAAGRKVEMPYTQEVTKVEGGKAWIKMITTVNGKANESTQEVDLTKKLDVNTWTQSQTNADGSSSKATWTQKSTGTESLTVKAGTYATTKYVGTLTYSGTGAGGTGSASGSNDSTFWVSEQVGLVKSIAKGGQVTEVMGQKIDATFTATTELQSVTN